MAKRLTLDQKRHIAFLYRSGQARYMELCREYNIGTTTLARIIKKFDIPARRGKSECKLDIRRSLTIDQESIALTMYINGDTCASIGSALKVSGKTIAETLKRNGIKLRRRGMRTMSDELKKKIRNSIARRWDNPEVRKKYIQILSEICFKPMPFAKHKQYNSKKYKSFRKTILDRDGNICRECFSDKKLDIHHLQPRALRPDLIFSPENVISLCHSCHMKEEARRKREFHDKTSEDVKQ